MIPRLTLNKAKYEGAVRQYMRELHKTGVEELKRQGKLFVEQCIKLTPPYPQERPLVSTEREQLRVGQGAVIRDLQKLFKPISKDVKIPRGIQGVQWPKFKIHGKNPVENARLQRSIDKYARAGDTTALDTIFKRLKVRYSGLINQVDAQLHKMRRNRRGRVTGKKGFFLVSDTDSIEYYLGKKLANIGVAKSGWKKAYYALGGKKLSNWISRHNGAGVYRPGFTNPNLLFVDVGNAVPFIQEAGRELQIIDRARASRARNLAVELKKVQAHLARKWKALR